MSLSANKLLRVLAYFYMRASIFLAYASCGCVSVVFRFYSIINSKPKKDLAIFLHSPINSDGHLRRFKVFYPYFIKKNIIFKEFGYLDEAAIHKIYDASRIKQYLAYPKIAWKRAFQIPQAIFYNSVILQRSLFPVYPDYSKPIFEKFLRKLNNNIILDIWDPVHLWNPDFTYSSFRYVDKITVNTHRLKEEYQHHFSANNIFVWPIAVDLSRYKLNKFSYQGSFPLFYTGSEGNTKQYLEKIIPILEKLSGKYPIELIVMGKYAPKSEILTIKHYIWDDHLFSNIISESAIGLYPNFNINKSKNYTVAGKVLDYMASKLPMVGADQGLPEGVNPNDIMIVANELQDWESALDNTLGDLSALRSKAENGYSFVKHFLNTEKMYALILEIIK